MCSSTCELDKLLGGAAAAEQTALAAEADRFGRRRRTTVNARAEAGMVAVAAGFLEDLFDFD